MEKSNELNMESLENDNKPIKRISKVGKKGLYREKKANVIITNIIRILLIALFVRAIIVKDHSQDFIIFITFALTYYPSILEKRFGVYLPAKLEITITLFIFAAQYLGEMKGFYELIPWWDTLLHTTSGVILGIIGFMFVYLLNEKGNSNVKLSPFFVVMFAFCFSMTMAVFWEFFEFTLDRLLGFNMQKFRLEGQDGLVDTMTDLMVATLGTLVSVIGGWIYIKKKNDVFFRDYFESWFKKKHKNKELDEKEETEVSEEFSEIYK